MDAKKLYAEFKETTEGRRAFEQARKKPDAYDGAYEVWSEFSSWAHDSKAISDQDLENVYNEPVNEMIIDGLT